MIPWWAVIFSKLFKMSKEVRWIKQRRFPYKVEGLNQTKRAVPCSFFCRVSGAKLALYLSGVGLPLRGGISDENSTRISQLQQPSKTNSGKLAWQRAFLPRQCAGLDDPAVRGSKFQLADPNVTRQLSACVKRDAAQAESQAVGQVTLCTGSSDRIARC